MSASFTAAFMGRRNTCKDSRCLKLSEEEEEEEVGSVEGCTSWGVAIHTRLEYLWLSDMPFQRICRPIFVWKKDH